MKYNAHKILYFHRSENITFWITSDFSIYLLHWYGELPTHITFLFVNENITFGYAFSEYQR